MLRKIFVIVLASALSACATQKDPIWLDAGKVRMSEYTDRDIIVLPVETSPSYRLSDGQEREIQLQLLNIVEDVFELGNIDAPETIRRFGSYPYTLEEVQNLLRIYRVDAAFVTSVFNYQRKDEYSPDTLGIRLAFVDANDPERAWATTREYVSSNQEQIGSGSLEFRVKTDMRAVERALRSGRGFSGFVGTIFTLGLWRGPPDDGPRLGVTTETRGSTQIGRQLGGTIDTKQSTYSVVVTAEDETGIKRLTVSNLSTRVEDSFAPTRAMDGSLPRYDVAAVDLQLRPGKNKIEIESVNGDDERTVRRLVLNRIENEEIFALGIEISEYEPTKDNAPRNEQLARQFAEARDNLEGEFILLRNEQASFREAMRRFDMISTGTAQNEDSVGIFYFYGKMFFDDGQIYLATYDSEADYADFTSIPIWLVDKRMRERGVIMLDLCIDDMGERFELEQSLPYALISFDSCGVHNQKLAIQIDELTNGGQSIRSAINSMFEDREQAQLQKF